jgi:hypothetical protein
MHDPRCRALCSAFHISEITETVSREETAWSGSSTMTDIDHDSCPPSRCSPAKPASPERTISTANRGHGEGSRKFATSKVIPSGVWSLTSRKLAPGHIRNPRLRGQDGIWRFGRNHGTTGGAALHDRATGEQQTFQRFGGLFESADPRIVASLAFPSRYALDLPPVTLISRISG